MLAVKLHKKPIAWLGKGSHVIPIVSWEVGRLQIRNWVKILTEPRTTVFPNNQIRYMTLMQIPADFPVVFTFAYGVETAAEWIYSDNPCHPLRDWPIEFKRVLAGWNPGHVFGAYLPKADAPEMILGEKLPEKCIRWTKDIRLLHGRKKRRTKGSDVMGDGDI